MNGTRQKNHAGIGSNTPRFCAVWSSNEAAFRSRALETRGRQPHLLAVTASFEAAEKAYHEAVANLRLGEVVRVRDAVGTLLLQF